MHKRLIAVGMFVIVILLTIVFCYTYKSSVPEVVSPVFASVSEITFPNLYYSEATAFPLELCNSGKTTLTGDLSITGPLALAVSVDIIGAAHVGTSLTIPVGGCALLALNYDTTRFPLMVNSSVNLLTGELMLIANATGIVYVFVPLRSKVTGLFEEATGLVRSVPDGVIDFGMVAQNNTKTLSFQVRNIGIDTLVASVVMTGSRDFQVVSSTSFWVEMGKVETVTISVKVADSFYTAAQFGDIDTAALTVLSNGNSFTFALVVIPTL